jgi:hypothetical protein
MMLFIEPWANTEISPKALFLGRLLYKRQLEQADESDRILFREH